MIASSVFIEDQNQQVTVRCPYMPEHIMHIDSLLSHLIRCPAKNKHLFKTCQYNCMHVVPKQQLKKHYQVCQDYKMYMQKKGKQEEEEDDDWEQFEQKQLEIHNLDSFRRADKYSEKYKGDRHDLQIYLKWRQSINSKNKIETKNTKIDIKKHNTYRKNMPMRNQLSQPLTKYSLQKNYESIINQQEDLQNKSVNYSLNSDHSYVLHPSNHAQLQSLYQQSQLESSHQHKQDYTKKNIKFEQSYIFDHNNNCFIRNPNDLTICKEADLQKQLLNDSFLNQSLEKLWINNDQQRDTVYVQNNKDTLGDILLGQLQSMTASQKLVFKKKQN